MPYYSLQGHVTPLVILQRSGTVVNNLGCRDLATIKGKEPSPHWSLGAWNLVTYMAVTVHIATFTLKCTQLQRFSTMAHLVGCRSPLRLEEQVPLQPVTWKDVSHLDAL